MLRAGSYLSLFFGNLLCFSIIGCTLSSPEPVSESLAILAAYQNRPQLAGRAVVKLDIQSKRAGRGDVLIELRGEDAPLTAGHFADLVQRGFYNGLRFHRVEKDPEPFLIYSGEPQGKRSSQQSSTSFQPLPIPLELKLTGERLPRYNETLDIKTLSASKLALPHRRGAVGMVRSTTLDSASSEFYISLASLPILDGRFAVFGYVLEGMDLVENLAPEDVILSAQIVGGAESLVTNP